MHMEYTCCSRNWISKCIKLHCWLAQLGERRSAEREVAGLTSAGLTLRVFKITEKKVLPL